MDYGLWLFLILLSLIIHKYSGCFFKSLVFSAVGGIGALCAVSMVSFFVPISVGFNYGTLAFSSLFSVPGVIFLLISKALLF